MKWTIAGLMLAGVIAALSATMLTASLRAERRVSTSGEPAEPRQVTIMVASRNLAAMSHIDADATVERVVPEEEVPQGAITSQLRVIGRILALPMVEGQPFLDKSFAPDYAGIHLASALPEGGRAMSITLSATNTIERLLYPGCLVDVVASFRLPGFGGRGSGEVVSSTVLQGVTVLAVGDRSVTDSASAGPGEARLEPADRNLVTLLVDATQAEALQLATTHGTVTLALRNPGDTGETTASGTMLSDLFGRRRTGSA